MCGGKERMSETQVYREYFEMQKKMLSNAISIASCLYIKQMGVQSKKHTLMAVIYFRFDGAIERIKNMEM